METCYPEDIAEQAARDLGEKPALLLQAYEALGRHIHDELVAERTVALGRTGEFRVLRHAKGWLRFTMGPALNDRRLSWDQPVDEAAVARILADCGRQSPGASACAKALLYRIAGALRSHHRVEVPYVAFLRWLPIEDSFNPRAVQIDARMSLLDRLQEVDTREQQRLAEQSKERPPEAPNPMTDLAARAGFRRVGPPFAPAG